MRYRQSRRRLTLARFLSAARITISTDGTVSSAYPSFVNHSLRSTRPTDLRQAPPAYNTIKRRQAGSQIRYRRRAKRANRTVPVPAQRPHKLSPTAECHFTFKQRDGWRRSNGAPATVIRQRRGRRSAAGAGLG
ncbi:hypothetical protein MRX96_036106 [Rhipicephalus microplus]